MTDKKVYAWVCRYVGSSTYIISTGDETSHYDVIEPLYSLEEVRYVIENNELPKRPVAWVCWDDGCFKQATNNRLFIPEDYDNIVPVYTADELLAELQKEI